MADIIQLRGSPHERTQSLLPWYVNQTLEADERVEVEAHLVSCAECREELEAERALAASVATMPIDIEHGWSSLDARLGAAPPRRSIAPVPFLRRPVALGWAMAAQLAAAAVILVGITSLHETASPVATYHALGAAPDATAGNAIILFAPETRESEMRAVLDGADARLVDGPTATGAFVLRIDEARRDQLLARLKQSRSVLLAEPIDVGDAQ